MEAARRAGPLLVINPSTDRELGRLARGFVIDSQATPETLEVALRRRFPKIVVHRRELSGEDIQSWYVYREGHLGLDGNSRSDLVAARGQGPPQGLIPRGLALTPPGPSQALQARAQAPPVWCTTVALHDACPPEGTHARLGHARRGPRRPHWTSARGRRSTSRCSASTPNGWSCACTTARPATSELARFDLPEYTNEIWHGLVPDILAPASATATASTARTTRQRPPLQSPPSCSSIRMRGPSTATIRWSDAVFGYPRRRADPTRT